MKETIKHIAIYSRKSKFTGKGESIENQIELCKEYIRKFYGEQALQSVVVYEDEGFSGGNLNRPSFKNMMEAVKNKEIKAIVVYRLDRISRNISDFASLVEDLGHMGIAFISIREQFDTESPMGRAMMYIASVFSQLERETIAERIRDNMHELAKTGRWLGGTTPTGYRSVSTKKMTIDGKSKSTCKLEVIPEEAEKIKLIFETFATTKSLTKTEAELLRLHIESKTGKHFTRFSIKSILQNPVYAVADEKMYQYFKENNAEVFSSLEDFDGNHGVMAYNRTKQEKGKATINLPMEAWIVSTGEHAGLISSKTWLDAQMLLEENKSKGYRRARINEALLTGMIYCSCGERMYPKLASKKKKPGPMTFSYVCSMKTRSKKSVCNQKNINGNMLDKAIIEQIKQLSEDRNQFIEQLEKNRNLFHKNLPQYDETLLEVKEEKKEIEKKIETLVDALVEAGDSNAKNYITKRIEALDLENKNIDLRIRELEELSSAQALSESGFDILRELLSTFAASIDKMTIEEKRAAIRTLVRKVVWDGEHVRVFLFGAPGEEIEYPEIAAVASNDANDNLEDKCIEENEYFCEPKTYLGEDSK